MSLQIDFQTCSSELLERANPIGRSAYTTWRNRKDLSHEVVPFVEGFVHSRLFTLTLADYEQTVNASEHALGDVDSREQLRAVEDFTCPFAFQHIFHEYLEVNGNLPTWQEMSAWLKKEARNKYIEPLLASLGNINRPELARAVRWRLGKFYYSTMREVELLIRLREEYNLPLRYHLLADVLLRVDFWLGDILICVWFANRSYRSAEGGRKSPANAFFHGTKHPFRILDIKVERQGFGKFWRVSDASLKEIAAAIRQAQS